MKHSLSYWLELIPSFRLWDIVDVLIVAFIIYRFLLLIRGTKAPQAMIGLGFVAVLYFLADRLEIRTLSALLSSVFDNLFIIFIILFQADIRRVLSQFGKTSFFSRGNSYRDGNLIEELVKSSISLSNRKVGALIVLEKDADVTDFTDAGVSIDSALTKELLTSIFLPVSPLHDGAVIIRKGRIFLANCFLPLSTNSTSLKSIGTRHRAALGLSEETDAVCLVVSEENGSISVATGGRIIHNLDSAQLRKALLEYL